MTRDNPHIYSYQLIYKEKFCTGVLMVAVHFTVDLLAFVCKLPISQSLESSFFMSRCRRIYMTNDLSSLVVWDGQINIEGKEVGSAT